MILQALYEYYQRKAADPNGNIAPPGFEWKEIPFIIVVDDKGTFINLEDTRSMEGKHKKVKKFLVIKTKGRSGTNGWQVSNVLWDHQGYVLNYPKDDSEKAKVMAQKQHTVFRQLVSDLSNRYPSNLQFRALTKFYENPAEMLKVFNHQNWADCQKMPGVNLSFRVAGSPSIVSEDRDLYASVNNNQGSAEAGPIDLMEGICLVTGMRGAITQLHSRTPVPGGESNGKLVSFQKNSGYDSYGKEQGLNAPVSKAVEDAYTTALNELLGKDSRNKFKMADTTVVFWAHKQVDFEAQFPAFFSAPEKDDPDRNIKEVHAFFESVYTGKLNLDGNTPFYVLGLSPNAARISVRFWKSSTVAAFANNLVRHFTDLEMVKSKFEDKEHYSLFNLLTACVFEHKIDNVPPYLPAKLIECILDGSVYPESLQQQCLRRIRAEQSISRVRAAILKACLNRKISIYKKSEKPITMALDKENNNQGYLCGRLFAVLEKIQEDAQGNANIRERYYGAASSTPVTVFGRMLNIKNHHMAKLGGGTKVYYEKLLQEIMEGVDSTGLPAHLSLDDQSRFAIGYYHQRQDLFTKKDKSTN